MKVYLRVSDLLRILERRASHFDLYSSLKADFTMISDIGGGLNSVPWELIMYKASKICMIPGADFSNTTSILFIREYFQWVDENRVCQWVNC